MSEQSGVTRLHSIELTKGRAVENREVSTVTTAGAVTYSVTQLLGGLVLRDPNGAGRTDIAPTAAQIITALNKPTVGASFEFIIRNTADDAETITLGGSPAGITYSGTMTIAQNNTKKFLAVVTSPTAVTIYSLGTVVH